jgi:hypothetical protein
VKIYLRKDRRQASGRDASLALRTAGRPAAPRDDIARPSPNSPRAP